MTTFKDTEYQFNYEVNRDLVYYFDENRVEIIYTQPGTNTKTRQYVLVADLSTEKLCVKRVLSCCLYGEPKLLIVCGDSNNKISFFWYCVITNTSKAIEFEASVVGDVTEAKMTKAPFEVDYVFKTKLPEKKKCYALVLGMQDGSTVLFILNIDRSSNISVSFKYLDKEEGDNVGHVTSIFILPQDADNRRMGHHDPQIILGYSKGAIRAYRFRATVYSHKASRIGLPIDLSEFTEFPGYPITHLSCARIYNSLKLIVSFAQEKPNDAQFENARAYVKLIEIDGTKKNALKIFRPPRQSAYIAEAHMMPHYEDSIDMTIVLYSSLSRTFNISVWNLDNKKNMKHTLEKEITESSCLEKLEPAEQTKPDDNYLLKNPEKIIEFAFRGHAVGLKRKATKDFFKESLEALEFQNKREKRLCKDSITELGDHYFFKNPEMIIESTSSSQAAGLKRKATVDYINDSFEAMEFPNKQQKIMHESSPLDDNDGETSASKDKKEEQKRNEQAQDEAQEKTSNVIQYSDVKEDSTEAGGIPASFEEIEEIKEPLTTGSEIMEEIVEPLYAESQVMEESFATESDVMKEFKESFNTEAKEQSDMEAIETHIDKHAEDNEHADLIEYEIEEFDQEYEYQKALETKYYEEIAEREQAHLNSLVFPDYSQYDEKKLSWGESIDEELKEDETDEEAVNGSVFSQGAEFIEVPRFEEEFFDRESSDRYDDEDDDDDDGDDEEEEDEDTDDEENNDGDDEEEDEEEEDEDTDDEEDNDDDDDEDVYFDAEEGYDEVEYVEESESSDYNAEGGYRISRLYPASSDSSDITDSSAEESSDEERNGPARLFVFLVDFQ